MAREPKTKAPNVKGDYPVGYGKPPIEHQIKKGERRNPAGRPKRKPPETDLDRLLFLELQKEMELTENGKPKKVSKAAVLVTQLVYQAVKGDRRAIEYVFKHMASANTSAAIDAAELTPEAIASYLKRNGRGEAADG